MFKYMWYTPFTRFLTGIVPKTTQNMQLNKLILKSFFDCYNWLSVSMENFQNFQYDLSLCLKIVHLLGVQFV
jgi:hypothetical protein